MNRFFKLVTLTAVMGLFITGGAFAGDNLRTEEPIVLSLKNVSNTGVTPVKVTSVKASHILVKSEQQAKDIKTQINNGASFESMAKEYSMCPSGANGGDLGFFSRGQMVPEFENAAFGLALGKVSDPVKTQFGYHLIKVTDKK